MASNEPAGEPTRVLVISEDPLARRSLSAQLRTEPGITALVLAADDASERAEVIVYDVGLDEDAGLQKLRELDRGPLVALLPSSNRASETFAAGARALFLRDGDLGILAASIEAIKRGAIVLDESIAQDLIRPPAPALPSKDILTPRELEVLELLARGLSNKQIAQALDVTDHTAKFHVTAIMNKLGAETRTEAVVLAARIGLVTL